MHWIYCFILHLNYIQWIASVFQKIAKGGFSAVFLIFYGQPHIFEPKGHKSTQTTRFLFLELSQTAIYQRFWPLISGTQKAHKFLKNRYFLLDSCVLLWYNKSTKNQGVSTLLGIFNVGNLVTVFGYEPKGRGFESLPACH